MRVNNGKFLQQKMREMNLDRSDLDPCVNKDCQQDLIGEVHGDDF